MNKEIVKAVYDVIRAEALELAEKVRSECEECGGSGIDCRVPLGQQAFIKRHAPDSLPKCSSCSPCHTQLLALAEARCWHEQDIHYAGPLCTICGKKAWYHHTPTIETMVEDLKTLGVYEKLVRYCGMSIVIKKTERKPCPANGEVNWITFDYANMQIRFAEILQTPEYFTQVIISYFESYWLEIKLKREGYKK